MDNYNSGFVPYDEDSFDYPLFDNLIEVDPALVLPNVGLGPNNAQPQQQNELFCNQQGNVPFANVGPNNAQPQQQNDPFCIQQNVPFAELSIEDLLIQDNNNNFPSGGEVGNLEAGPSRKRGRDTMIQEDQVQSMHGNNNNNNFSNGGGVGNFEMGVPSNQSQNTNENMGPQNYQGVISLPYWPDIPRPFICNCCQVLRQIIHTNGTEFEKLEIHGMVGVISHAIIQRRNIAPGGPSSDTFQMIDFCYRSAEQIKSLLVKYCTQQIASGYIIVEDPISAYYETLCTGMDWTKDFREEYKDLIPPNEVEPEPEPEPEPLTGKKTSSSKRNRAEQIKRGKLMTLNDLKDVFHITIEDAAKRLDMSETCVKNICSRGKLERWPQRKVNGNAKQVRVLRRALDSPHAGTRAATRREIERLQKEIIDVCGGITPTGIQMVQF